MCGAIIVYDDDEWELYNRVIKLMWRGCETAKSPAFWWKMYKLSVTSMTFFTPHPWLKIL